MKIREEEDPYKGENIFEKVKRNANRGVEGKVNMNLLLLYSKSMMHQIVNPYLLENIRKVVKPTTIHCNTQSTSSTLEGDIRHTTMVHIRHEIANAVSLFAAKNNHQITYHSLGRDIVS
jgi:hypothetical protein